LLERDLLQAREAAGLCATALLALRRAVIVPSFDMKGRHLAAQTAGDVRPREVPIYRAVSSRAAASRRPAHGSLHG
jgi:hypothetical protein